MARFVANPAFMQLLENSQEVDDARMETAENVAQVARENAPQRSGSYKENIHVERELAEGRPRARVVADDPTGAAGLIEFGTEDTPAFAPLRRALEMVLGTDNLTNDE